jgi:hypothetical protein
MSRLLPLAFVLAFPVAVGAQVRASERGSVSQTVDGTVFTLDYSRPVARGRDSVIGRVVKWGETWTPGANWATTLELSKNAWLEGKALPQGKYSLWLVPQPAPAPWTLIVSRAARLFHTQHPPKEEDQLRLDVKPENAPFTEVLTWGFPLVNADGATLDLRWGTWRVPLHVRVEPTRPAVLTARQRNRYLGIYRMAARNASDTTVRLVEVIETATGIQARMPKPLWEGIDRELDLFPAGRDRFRAGIRQEGKLYDVEEIYLLFRGAGERAESLEFTNDEGKSFGKGERTRE